MRLVTKFLVAMTFAFIGGQALAAQAEAQAHLWRVEKEGKVFFILGSIHEFPSRLLRPEVWQLLDQSKKLVTEIDEGLKLVYGLLKDPTRLPKGQSLDRLLSPEAWKNLLLFLDKKYPLERIKSMTPFYAAQLVVSVRNDRLERGEFHAVAERLAKTAGEMDKELRLYAEGKKIPIGTLDTFESIDKLFVLPVDDLEKLLLATEEEYRVEITHEMKSKLELIETYPENRIDTVKKKIRSSKPEHRKRLYTARNHEWLPKIAAAESQTLFVVGAGHLYGREGLMALLKARGFRLSPVRKGQTSCGKVLGN